MVKPRAAHREEVWAKLEHPYYVELEDKDYILDVSFWTGANPLYLSFEQETAPRITK